MAASNRATILTKVHTVLKKHVKPRPQAERNVLECLIYATLLENATFEKADEALTALHRDYFDFNEIRVAGVRDLSDTFSMLPRPAVPAERVRSILQHVFEHSYSFDLENLRKLNLGKAIHYLLEEMTGVSQFAASYLAQNALGGHVIPLDEASSRVLGSVGALADDEVAKKQTGGVDRAIAKAKGPEFFCLLHEFSAELFAHPRSTNLIKVLTSIEPDAKSAYSDNERTIGAYFAKHDADKFAADKAARAAAAAMGTQGAPAAPAAPAEALDDPDADPIAEPPVEPIVEEEVVEPAPKAGKKKAAPPPPPPAPEPAPKPAKVKSGSPPPLASLMAGKDKDKSKDASRAKAPEKEKPKAEGKAPPPHEPAEDESADKKKAAASKRKPR
ncbi:MAG TPA: hypothetical protein VGE52_07150 [Pirellulales bacterium]